MNRSSLAFAASAVLSLGLSQAALAADMPVKAPIAPAAVVVQSWSGFYFGVHGGYGWADDSDFTVSDPFTALGPGTFTTDPRVFVFDTGAKGGIAGIHAGYNWQFAPTWVLGVEVDASWVGIKGDTSVSPIPYPGDLRPGSSVVTSFELKYLASARARIGYATPNLLAYLTGGVAFTSFDASGNMICPAIPGACGVGVQAPGQFSAARVGWVAGAGAEYRIGASNWIIGAEYLFYRFDGTDGVTVPTISLATGAPATFGTCPAPGTPCVGYSVGDFDIHTFRARISYKF